jgi:hypothetical protein
MTIQPVNGATGALRSGISAEVLLNPPWSPFSPKGQIFSAHIEPLFEKEG